MDFRKLGEDVINKAKSCGAEEAEAYFQNLKTFNVSVRKGEVETLQKSVSKGLGLRVFINRQLGFSYTSDFSEKSLEETIKKTVELARVTEAKPWNGLPDFGPQELPDLELYDPEAASIPDEKKITLARDVEKIALSLDDRITNTEGGSFSSTEGEAALFSTRGIAYQFQQTGFSFGVYVIAGEGDDMQSGSWGSSKRFFRELTPLEEVARKAVERAVEKMNPRPVPTKKVPVVFDRYAAPAFWMGILSSLNGDAVFRKTTFMTGQLEKAIASPLITVVDNPTLPRFIGSLPCDGEGNVTRRSVVIDQGVLKMFYYDSQTARKAGVRVHTIARRGGYKSGPFAGPLNIIVENGQEGFESLLKDIKEGFYVKGLRGTGTDVTTGSFSVGASGFWIVDGAPAHPVDGLTLGGSTLEILKSIDRVADDLDLRGSTNSPSFRVAELTVGGKGM